MRSKSIGVLLHSMIAAAAAAAVILTVSRPIPAYAAPDPMEVVKSLVTPALQILGDKTTPLKERQEKLRNLANTSFDFTAMSRSALGYHWKSLNDQQKKDFVQTFSSFIEDSYLSKIQDYTGFDVQFTGESQPDPGVAQVKSSIIQPGKQPVPVNYMLRQASGKWLVYDVTVDNISIIANYRNQFNRVMNNKGFDTLLSDLKSKQAQLEAQLGTPHAHD
jgi:phospholipid transport system substrate-binding protein